MQLLSSLRRAGLLLALLLPGAYQAQAQTPGVGIGTTAPDASAALDVSSTTQGLLPPRLSLTERNALSSPATGLLIFNTTTRRLNTWNGSAWDEALATPNATTILATTTFGTPGQYTYTVPTGVTSLRVDASGSDGSRTSFLYGGAGARVQATLAVTPGETLTLYVGGRSNGQAGGYNGGGAGGTAFGSSGAGGGGASDVRRGGATLAERLLVAAGGGGASNSYAGGAGGRPNGATGDGSSAGGGATQSSGGSPNGGLGQGGNARSDANTGGGGGGYYGGGGNYGGGGGGSSWVSPSGSSNVQMSLSGGTSGITITPGAVAPAPALDGTNFVNVPGTWSVSGADVYRATGNVGIGTSTPGQKLEVAGNVKLTGTSNGITFPDNTTQTTAASGAGFILNQTATDQTGGFRVSGNGTVAGALSAGTVSIDGGLTGNGSTVSGVAVGVRADGGLNLGQNGINGIYLGYGAGRLNTGSTNMFVGYFSGLTNTTGQYNQFIGYRSGQANTQGTQNQFSGFESGLSNVVGTQNQFIGYQSGYTNTGSYNTFSGFQSGYFSTVGASNVFNGFRSGYYNTTGSLNTALGNGSGPADGSGTINNATAIGANVALTQSNTVVLGNNASVGIGTSGPSQKLEVAGTIYSTSGGFKFPDGSTQASANRSLSISGQSLSLGGPGGNTVTVPGDNLGNHSATTNLGLSGNWLSNAPGNANGLRIDNSGNVGVGTGGPTQRLDVDGAILARGNGAISNQGAYLQWNRVGGQGETWLINQQGGGPGGIYFGKSDQSNNVTEWARFSSDGKLGIGTTSPSAILDVQGIGDVGPNNFAFFRNFNNSANSGYVTGNNGDISIRASGPVLAAEFYATSDRRLKTVVGRSNNVADLALLNKLRITDYTMRDRVQFGERTFKKVIAQEVEEVLPQAVTRQTGFLPDVYALATAVQALPGDSLLVLTLPAGLPAGGALAGQRLRLIGTSRTVLATVARPAAGGSRTLTVRRAQALAGGEVFVYGLEHADVRAVDYEALSMLNVSATQELARQVAELKARAAAAEAKAAQATATTEAFEARLRALEAGSGQARR